MAHSFHQALSAAIEARGLTLERLRAHLAEQGHTVSAATLSGWQRGRIRPGRHRSVRAIAGLETILGLPEYSLVSLIGPPRQAGAATPGKPVAHEQLCPAGPSVRPLLAGLGGEQRPLLRTLTCHDHIVVGERRDERLVRTTLTLKSVGSGVDRYVAIHYNEHGRPPHDLHVNACQIGEVRTDPANGLVAAELLFDRPLAAGETYVLDYTFSYRPPGPPADCRYRWFRQWAGFYLLTVEFTRPAIPAKLYRTWQPSGTAPLVSLAPIRLIAGTSAHIAETDQRPGLAGLRWEWS
ncbi:helix-turn-helix domain-containing protein [Nonomuraea africana]|uniref:XRE family transcriptional regulator n=1 Tax=Nonomuraea africana TaxID=46171 RepID=A0ABR9K673_9ACTN|nr:hypothetical protein [Nonomuraea africana]MBE1557513.1 hypothetical protein [Nonomuraea africana]